MEFGEPHRKEGPNTYCRICGGSATGLHYGVFTCEGCKVFFKRYMTKFHLYHCYFGGNCVINRSTRSKCKSCRYRKCVDQGMSVEAIRLGRTPKLFRTMSAPAYSPISKARRGTPDDDVSDSPRYDDADTAKPSGVSSVIVHAAASGGRLDVDDLDPPSPLLSSSSDRPKAGHHSGTFDRSDSVSSLSASSNEKLSDLFKASMVGGRAALVPSLCKPTDHTQPSTSLRTFSDENLRFMISDFVGEHVRPCRLPDIKHLSSGQGKVSPAAEAAEEPSTLQQYYGVMQARNSVLEDCISSVTRAADTVFSAQMKLNEEAVEKWHGQGLVPFQPECTLDHMMSLVQKCAADFAEKLFRFALLLPGFTELSESDRSKIIQDRWYVAWLVTQSTCYREDEFYLPMGALRYHFGRYWMSQMVGGHFVRFLFSVAADISELQLKLQDTFLLLAVCFFRLNTADTIGDTAYVDFLYMHYLDALIHLIGHGRAEIITKLRAVLKRFSVVNEVHRRFILGANLDHVPSRGLAWDTDEMAIVTNLNPDSFERIDFGARRF